jgi:hypothetical protein
VVLQRADRQQPGDVRRDPAVSVAVATAIVVAVGVLLLHADSGRGAFGFLGLAAAMIPLSYLPNLAISENFASYRSIGAPVALLTLYLWLGLWGMARAMTSQARDPARLVVTEDSPDRAGRSSEFHLARFDRRATRTTGFTSFDPHADGWPELVAFVLLFAASAGIGLWSLGSRSTRWPAVTIGALAAAAFTLGGLLIAARNVTTLVVEPQSVELQMLRSALNTPRAPDPQHVVFVKPNPTQGAAPLVRYDEFGPPSSYFPWVASPAVRLVLRERVPSAVPRIDVLAWDQTDAAKALHGDAFVDMRQLRKRRVGWSLWSLDAASRPTVAPAPSAQRP